MISFFTTFSLNSLILFSLSSLASAAVHRVSTNADELDDPVGVHLSLREAIRDAASGDTIEFSGIVFGGYTMILTQGELVIDGKDLTFDASSLPDPAIITRSIAFPNDSTFRIKNSSTVVMNNLILKDGVTIGSGGAIHSSSGSDTTLINCQLLNNTAAISGGAIFNDNAALTLTDTTVKNNSTSNNHGGGIYSSGVTSSLTITNSIIEANISASSGGGIYLTEGAATATITNSSVTNNKANKGGGLYNTGSALIITRSSFSGNQSALNGGGIFANNSSSLILRNSTLAENTAKNGGGIFIQNNSPTTFRSCTVAANSSIVSGGGIYMANSSVLLTNTIIADNSAQTGNDIAKVSGNVSRSGACLIGDHQSTKSVFPAGSPNVNGDFVGTFNAPISPQLAPLSNYGGLSLSMPPLAASLAVDSAGTTVFAFDQRAFTRVVGAALDIGAAEVQASLVVTTSIDEDDGGLGIGAGDSLREILNEPLTPGTRVTFAPSLNGATITLLHGHISISDLSVFVDGSTLVTPITLDANGLSRVFLCSISSASTTNLALSHLNFTNGTEFAGGAIYSNYWLTLHQCDFFNNEMLSTTPGSGLGGAIYNTGNAVISDCNFNANTITKTGSLSITAGGAIYHNGSPSSDIYADALLKVTRCTFTNNSCVSNTFNASGGAIYSNGGRVIITKSTLSNNSVFSQSGDVLGGAIASSSGTFLKIHESSIHNNQASTSLGSSSGGGLYHSGDDATTPRAGSLSIVNSTIHDNIATTEGGGITLNAVKADIILKHVTVSKNLTEGTGGGIAIIGNGSAVIWMENSIIAANHPLPIPGSGSDISNTSTGTGTIQTVGNNLIGNNETVSSEFPASSLVGTPGSLLDPMLGTLGMHGGLTPTQPLLAGSPAIDAGIYNSANPRNDQRGFLRNVDAAPDLGAHENNNDFNYALWALERIPTAGDSTFAGNNDLDSMANGIEYSLNLNPSQSDPEPSLNPVYILTSGLEITFSYRSGLADLVYIVESSQNLTTFTEVYRYTPSTRTELITAAGITVNIDRINEQIHLTAPNASSPGFLRVKAQLIP